ncbi:polymeric immunoglobulin receptor-like isoform X6 [Dicentrarchus labrax]|uniref:Immunoglobulin domain-containing protein n=1 Tax=Dicentrarchus labrax TaxID=13489 RepID=A0A8C4DRD1_DICLA|nr:polymeric immunoglobulin receptor-like isoform X6 [Dicentrarchus labrax]
MRSSLLLLLSLMTGCELRSEVKGCRGGWVEFTCKYPKTTGNYKNIGVVSRRGTFIQATKKNVWETKDSISLYHDTQNEELRVAIRQLQTKDFGEYQCKEKDKDRMKDREKFKVEVEEDGCQQQLNQTAYRTAKTTITCDYPAKFFCKDNGLICEEILSTKSSLKSNRKYNLTETDSGFNVSISNVSSHDAGLYWCGENEGNYRTGLGKIQLKVEDITTFTRSPTIGQNFTYWCEYPNGAPIKKFICKGEDPSICQPLVNTAQRNMNNGKFSMKEDELKRNVTITVREITADDSGTYWCGAESTDTKRSNTFFHRCLLTVVSPTTSTPSITSSTSDHPVATLSVASTQSTVAPAESGGSSVLTVTIVVVICVVVLALLLIVLFFYKGLCSQTTRNGEAKNNKEDRTYEEIQELPQKPDSGTALKTIYVTANFPTNPSSAPHHHSNINFQSSSGDVGGDTYFTVRDGDQHPTYSTVNHPSRSSADPFYSTVNKPQ